MLLWIIAKLLIHFLFAIIWEMKNMLFYMLLFHIFKQWRMFGLDENYTGDLRTVKINTAITFKEKLSFAIATPASDSEANLISVVKSTSTELNNIIVNIKGVVTGGSNGQIRVFFVGK
jgi:hypothetical protein